MTSSTQFIGENEIGMKYENNRNNMLNMEPGLNEWCDTYTSKMISYMQAVPHIPPTPFEMKLRHDDIKSGLIKQYKKEVENQQHTNQLIARLENKIDIICQELLKLNSQEYGKCQLGFIFGWKCNINKPHPEVTKLDDRF